MNLERLLQAPFCLTGTPMTLWDIAREVDEAGLTMLARRIEKIADEHAESIESLEADLHLARVERDLALKDLKAVVKRPSTSEDALPDDRDGP